MSDPSPSTDPPPITPLGIIARNLVELRERARALDYADPNFVEALARTTDLASGLDPYLSSATTPASTTLNDLAADATRHDWPALFAAGRTGTLLERAMLSGHVEAQLLKMLVRVTRATRVLEIGMFLGHSALAMAEGLPDGGRVIACELDRYVAGVAREWFDRSPHGAKIAIEIGPASETLRRLRDGGDAFDFVFVDADKARYAEYYELVVGSTLLTTDGLLCIDNTLYGGEAYVARARSSNGRAIADFNRLVAADSRVEQVLLPIRDGLTIVRRVSS